MLKRISKENSLSKWLNLKLRTRIEIKNENRFNSERFSSSKKFLKTNINNHLIIENRKSKIENKTSEIENYFSEFNSDQSAI